MTEFESAILKAYKTDHKIGSKWCDNCKQFIPENKFGIQQLYCKKCVRIKHWNNKNGIKYKTYTQKEYDKYYCYTCKKWLTKNNFHKGRKTRCKICASLKSKQYNQKPNVKTQRNLMYRKRWAIDPMFRLNKNISLGIRQSLNGNKKRIRWEHLTGYTLQQLKNHIEKQFKPYMSWENYGEWHIDHIIPISKFNFTKSNHIDFRKCWSLENLQPLWASENITKSNKLPKPFQPSLLI